MRGAAAYAASKAAMMGLMRAVALDHAGDGVTCNAVAPGWIATDSQSTHEASQAHSTPVGRAGSPDEVATAIATLCLPGGPATHRAAPSDRRRELDRRGKGLDVSHARTWRDLRRQADERTLASRHLLNPAQPTAPHRSATACSAGRSEGGRAYSQLGTPDE